jgi:hypothetical protein
LIAVDVVVDGLKVGGGELRTFDFRREKLQLGGSGAGDWPVSVLHLLAFRGVRAERNFHLRKIFCYLFQVRDHAYKMARLLR